MPAGPLRYSLDEAVAATAHRKDTDESRAFFTLVTLKKVRLPTAYDPSQPSPKITNHKRNYRRKKHASSVIHTCCCPGAALHYIDQDML